MALTSSPNSSEYCDQIAQELKLRPPQVMAVLRLLDDGATVPFIARYRKEATGTLDEVFIGKIRDRAQQLEELGKRREAILASLKERNLLTPDLQKKIMGAKTMTALEDIYAPFRPKRRTRATIARERGLEALSDILLAQGSEDPLAAAKAYVDASKEVPDVETALAGARDIIAETVSDHTEVRKDVRVIYLNEGTVVSKVVASKKNEPDAAKYRDYFDWSEPLDKIPSHRLLAIRRGEKEGFLSLRISIPEDQAINRAASYFVTGKGGCAMQVYEAVEDGCRRLLFKSMETEVRTTSRAAADGEAIEVFAENLRELLLASPLGQKRVLALDPGFRTGCKLVALNAQGKMLHNTVIYLVGSNSSLAEAAQTLKALVKEFKIEAVAIGNGTASRETEAFVRKIGLPSSVAIVVVNESGASVYSASEVARREFPDHDVTVRGAVSIGRRLQDPLAELVKIDPKSIGVGQYQHDVDQGLLKKSLDHCVESCVNAVGVEVNTASRELLSYVSGLNLSIAEKIVAYRNANGPFKHRKDLLKVSGLGAKAYEQAAGFLRIRGAKNPLDSSAVHPERYDLVKKMAGDLSCNVEDLLTSEQLRNRIDLRQYVVEGDVGMPTLKDIMSELAKPGRDPRQTFEVFSFTDGVEKPEDLKVGMKLPGIVTNVTKFGAFVDIGVHQDGLVHISQLADSYVENPADVVKVNQKVQVTVTEVDLERKRIALSMKAQPEIEGRGGSAKAGAGAGNRRNSGGGRGQQPSRGGSRNSGSGGGAQRPRADEPLGGDWFSQAMNKNKK